MAYADHSQASSRTISIVIVALVHAVLGYAFVSGLGIKYVKKAAEQLNVIDVADEPPPPEEPPPPPPPPDKPVPPPPVYVPPPKVQIQAPAAPVLPTVPELPRLPPAPTAPPAPPAAKPIPGTPRGNPAGWVTTDDYPARALREGREGTTGFSLSYNEDGKPTNCQITASSGSDDLDQQTCKSLMRNARFKPGRNSEGQPVAGTYSNRVRWVIPK